MTIQSIHLENFRNYRRLDLHVGPSINVFYGNNAQGKTNIMEAIYLCACARSHRTSKDRDLIFHNRDMDQDKKEIINYYQVHLNFYEEENSHHESVRIRYEEEEGKRPKRTVYSDLVPYEKMQDYLGNFNAVIFAPEDLQLIKEGPSIRRRYVDLLISQVKPTYFFNLQRFSRILIQRNSVIKAVKQAYNGNYLSEEQNMKISYWDYPLAEAAAKIITDRIYFTKKISDYAAENHLNISNGNEKLDVTYKTITGLLSEVDENDPYLSEKIIEEKILDKYLSTHKEDCDRGITIHGPHRDDLEILLNNENIRIFASQGQQRSAALSLKLAELFVLKDITKQAPVLLLDDVFSELDVKRRQCLLSSMKGSQVFVTCTDRFYIENLFDTDVNDGKNISFFRVSEGFAEPA